MYLNELDNFLPNIPDLGSVPQVALPTDVPQTDELPSFSAAPQIGGLSSADECIFRKVIEKYFAEDLKSGQSAPANASASDDAQLSSFNSQLTTDNGFGIGIPETDIVRKLHYEEADTVNTDEIRKQFPILHQKVNGHDLVWFDNGATTQKPLRVIDGLSDFYKTDYSNIHRGAHTLAARSTDQYEGAREKVARFINAPSKENILFVRGTTEGINLVAQTFGRKFLEEGDNVIVSTLDHHANIVPWQQISKERKAELRAIPIDRNGDLILSELERLITPHTKFISVGHVNNTFGTINDVESIIRRTILSALSTMWRASSVRLIPTIFLCSLTVHSPSLTQRWMCSDLTATSSFSLATRFMVPRASVWCMARKNGSNNCHLGRAEAT